MNSPRAAALLAVGLLAGTARAEVPWEHEERLGSAIRPAVYFALVGLGGYTGYFDRDAALSSRTTSRVAGELSICELRWFHGRFGIGGTAIVAPNSEDVDARTALPALACHFITRSDQRTFDFASLQFNFVTIPFFFIPLPLRTGLKVSYTFVPLPPSPLELTAAAWYDYQSRWYIGIGVRVGAGWWFMRKAEPTEPRPWSPQGG